MIRRSFVIILLAAVVVLCLFPIPTNSYRLAESKVLRIAYVYGPQELLHATVLRFVEEVERESAGSIRIKLYPNGQLGDERALVEGLRLNSSDIVLCGTSVIGWTVPEYSVVDAPFLWRDYEHLESVWNGGIGEGLRDAMKRKSGVEFWDIWPRGQRYLTSTSRRIIHPRDLKGFKLRVPDLDIYIKSWTVFGANTTPLPFSDMFMGLKLGVVDGQENPLAAIYSNHLHEVQHYIMETEHLIGFYLFCVGPHLAERFSVAEREILHKGLAVATEWYNRELAEAEKNYRHLLEEYGIEFVPVDREAFRALAIEKIPPLFQSDWVPDIYRRIAETP